MVSQGVNSGADRNWKAGLKRSMGRRLTAKSKLLDWASSVVGLPLTDVNQVCLLQSCHAQDSFHRSQIMHEYID